MLLGSIVFMSRIFRGQCISVVLVFILKLSVASQPQIQTDNASTFDNDFGKFLRDLGSKVYNAKIYVTQNETRPIHTTTPTPLLIKNYRRNQNAFNTQKAVLQDVLMMKLVSYYEDKYKLSHLEPTTTESITVANILDSNVWTKQNSYQTNFIEKDEALSSNVIPNPTRQVVKDIWATGFNRRMPKDMTTIEEYQVPEVIVF